MSAMTTAVVRVEARPKSRNDASPDRRPPSRGTPVREAGQLEDTATSGGEERAEGQTQHPAPPDDVGVPEDVPRD